jgi:hypothetical protein
MFVEEHRKHVNILCEQNSWFLSDTAGGLYEYLFIYLFIYCYR